MGTKVWSSVFLFFLGKVPDVQDPKWGTVRVSQDRVGLGEGSSSRSWNLCKVANPSSNVPTPYT